MIHFASHSPSLTVWHILRNQSRPDQLRISTTTRLQDTDVLIGTRPFMLSPAIPSEKRGDREQYEGLVCSLSSCAFSFILPVLSRGTQYSAIILSFRRPLPGNIVPRLCRHKHHPSFPHPFSQRHPLAATNSSFQEAQDLSHHLRPDGGLALLLYT